MKNAENKASYPYDERKIRKITLRRGTMNKETAKIGFPSRGKRRKPRKSAFPYEGKQEISENRLSPVREKKQTAKNGFPSRGKTRKQRKILSQDWENEKMWKIGFLKLGKNKKRKKMAVPILGRPKNGEKRISQPLEKNKKYCWELFQPLGRSIFPFFHSSEASDGLSSLFNA